MYDSQFKVTCNSIWHIVFVSKDAYLIFFSILLWAVRVENQEVLSTFLPLTFLYCLFVMFMNLLNCLVLLLKISIECKSLALSVFVILAFPWDVLNYNLDTVLVLAIHQLWCDNLNTCNLCIFSQLLSNRFIFCVIRLQLVSKFLVLSPPKVFWFPRVSPCIGWSESCNNNLFITTYYYILAHVFMFNSLWSKARYI